MSNGRVHLSIENNIAAILIDRPDARNAMTWAMYEELGEICSEIGGNPAIRAATIRGAGGEAFVAGTDIEQFRSFKDGADGIAYEKTIDALMARLEALPMPIVAIVEGWAIGGVPIARTLGNCLSMANYARVLAAFGPARAKKMLLLAETIGAREAQECGFVLEIAEAAELADKAGALCARLAKNAPVTMRASKEAIRRLVNHDLPDGDDLVRLCYGSRDFKIGVEAFMQKQRPAWTGS